MKLPSLTHYIDQPLVINRIQKTFPAFLIGGAACSDILLTKSEPKEKRKEAFIKNTIILAITAATTLIGARGIRIGGKQLIKGLMPIKSEETILNEQSLAINNFIKEHNIEGRLKEILLRAKNRALKLKEIQILMDEFKKQGTDKLKQFFNIISGQEGELTSESIFANMKRLPLYGAYAIGSGFIGGILADKITGTGSNEKLANKVKETIYQYFANTFLCIVGMGLSLCGLEKLHKKNIIKNITPLKKAGAIAFGIIGVGVLLGSVIANLIGTKLINPFFGQKNEPNSHIYSERHPELLDICIHLDDLATAGVYSGFKWIEAILPIFYMIAGYRAGTGHRNIHFIQHKNLNNFE